MNLFENRREDMNYFVLKRLHALEVIA